MTAVTANDESGKGTPRKFYRKPEVRKVRLKAEEAVLGFCKDAGSAGPYAPDDCVMCPTAGCEICGS